MIGNPYPTAQELKGRESQIRRPSECTCAVCRDVKDKMAVRMGENSKCWGTADCTCSVCREFKRVASKAFFTPGGEVPTPGYKIPVADMISDFHLALREVSKVTGFGCLKHGPLGGWRSIPDFKRAYQNSKARHAIAGLVEEGGLDGESGLPHLAHEAWNALALLQHAMEQDRDVAGRPSP